MRWGALALVRCLSATECFCGRGRPRSEGSLAQPHLVSTDASELTAGSLGPRRTALQCGAGAAFRLAGSETGAPGPVHNFGARMALNVVIVLDGLRPFHGSGELRDDELHNDGSDGRLFRLLQIHGVSTPATAGGCRKSRAGRLGVDFLQGCTLGAPARPGLGMAAFLSAVVWTMRFLGRHAGERTAGVVFTHRS